MCALVLTGACALPAETAAAAKPRVLANYPASAAPGSGVTVIGRIAGRVPRGSRVVLQQRVGGGWRSRATVKPSARRYRVRWSKPPRAGAVTVRVALVRRKKTLASAAGYRIAIVKFVKTSAPVRTPDPEAVAGIPAPGLPGSVTVRGELAVKPGEFLALDVGPRSLHGFLGKVTAVKRSGSSTVVATVPTTLRAVVPAGSFAYKTTAPQLRAAGARMSQSVNKSFSCDASASVTVSGSVDFRTGIDVGADWGVFSLNEAHAVASATASASLAASARRAASCRIERVELTGFDLPVIRFQVGVVPVVINPRITVYLNGDGSVEADVATSMRASVGVLAGLRYRKDAGFSPVGGFTPGFDFLPPTPTASGRLAVELTPTLDLELYGLGGPSIALHAGLALEAASRPPRWELFAPISATAGLTIPDLDLESPVMTVYQNRFSLARGNFSGGSGPGPGPEPSGPETAPDPNGRWNGTVTFDFPDKGCSTTPGEEWQCYDREMSGTITQDATSPPVIEGTGVVKISHEGPGGCRLHQRTEFTFSGADRFYVVAHEDGYWIKGGNDYGATPDQFFRLPAHGTRTQTGTCEGNGTFEYSDSWLFRIDPQPGAFGDSFRGSAKVTGSNFGRSTHPGLVTWDIRRN